MNISNLGQDTTGTFFGKKLNRSHSKIKTEFKIDCNSNERVIISHSG